MSNEELGCMSVLITLLCLIPLARLKKFENAIWSLFLISSIMSAFYLTACAILMFDSTIK